MGGFISDIFDAVADVIDTVVDAVVNTVNNVITAIKEGNIMDLVGMVGSFVIGGPVGLGLYAGVRFAVPGITQSLADHGFISDKFAMYLNVAAAIAATWYGVTNAGASGAIGNMISLGVSVETATYLAGLASQFAPLYAVGSTLYGVYDAYNMVKEMQLQYASAVASFESWYSELKNSRAKSDASFNESMAFATGIYYDRLPAQTLYSVFMPSSVAFIPVEQVQPAYWIESMKSPYRTEQEIVALMWQGKNDIPFNQKFGIDVL